MTNTSVHLFHLLAHPSNGRICKHTIGTPFLMFYFEILSDLQKTWKNCREFLYSLYPNSPTLNILPNLLLHTFYLGHFFLNHMKVDCMYHAPHFLTLHLLFLENNHSLWHFHFTVTKFRKVNPDVIIILNLSSVFQSHQLPQYVL